MALSTTAKQLKKLFNKHGKVESVRFRSIAFDDSSKVYATFVLLVAFLEMLSVIYLRTNRLLCELAL